MSALNNDIRPLPKIGEGASEIPGLFSEIEDSDILSLATTSKVIGLTPGSLRNWVLRGALIPAVHSNRGRAIGFKRAEVERFRAWHVAAYPWLHE